MEGYYWLAVVLHFGVNYMCITAVKGLFCYTMTHLRSLAASLMAAGYALLCLEPPVPWLGSAVCNGLMLLLECLIAFGWEKGNGRSCLLFMLLRLALDGLEGNQVLWAAVLCGVVLWVFRNEKHRRTYLPVELRYGDRSVRLTALYDTGHDLYDPVTGSAVLVVDGLVAESLTGLSASQLSQPVETLKKIPGYCLVPYKTVGQPGGLLLGLRIRNTRIGRRKGSVLVAFCPDVLDEDGKFQGLIGGRI